jgi:CheY-like chemotaxis protein
MKKALLVDDDPIITFVHKTILQKTGIFNDIKVVQNGRQAIDLLNKDPHAHPDIIFLDLDMPVMGGFAFLEAFKALNFPNKDKIKIVILSSSDNVDDKIKALSFGIQHYYTKPICERSIANISEFFFNANNRI